MLQVRFLGLMVAFLAFVGVDAYAQFEPEQDCFGALPVCNTVFQQGNSYVDTGRIQELFNLFPSSCLINGENNSVWYIFTISTAGDLEFSISPISVNDDYDFTIFNLTGNTCQDIIDGLIPEVRCNYAVTQGVPTGLAAGNVATSAGPNGSHFLAPISVQVGETYALLIDNFTKNGQGYSIDFANGTAGTADTVSPFLTSVDSLTCDTTTTLTINFSEPVECSSILADGTQFIIDGPQPIFVIGAVGTACASGQKFTTQATITLGAPILTKGDYYFHTIPGTGGISITDVCGRAVTPDSIVMPAPAITIPHFTYDVAASCYVDTVHFINTSLPSTSNGNPTWFWDFGGTGTSTLQDPAHVFPDTILYNIFLTATTVDGCTYTNDSVIPVERSYAADFTYQPTTGICPDVPVQFTDASPGSADTWFWSFGDNNISGDENPVHTYTAPGTYTVTLIISESSTAGVCTDTTSQELLVLPDVDADFSISAAQICEGSPVVFTDLTTGFPSAWLWDFGNGDTSILQNPTYTYDSIGAFTITLEVSNACNADVATENFQVFPIPVFDLGNDTAICFDRSVTLTAYPGATSTTWSTGQTGDSIVVIGAPIEVRASVNKDGCTYDDVIIIEELQEGCIIVPVPSAFTPNGDGFNDLWRLVNPQRLLSVEVWIYNRWGQVVFYDDKLEFAWDGNLKGEAAEMGVYSYVIKGFGESSRGREPILYKGNLTLVR